MSFVQEGAKGMKGMISAQAAPVQASHPAKDRLYRKLAWRMMPLLLLCYVANYIDRTNISIAQLKLSTDVHFSEQIYGIGVGLFFVGFILFEIPSNLFLDRIGARRTLLRIMVSWG